ncbi:MAG: serine/threonine protein kinase [Betaproteobacteria bacterium]|nr:MAG: serine/threonine protein kinase [Betaproteobacteria bacterium]
MNLTPEQQWSALSALYEEADALPADALPAWLKRLEEEQHPLLSQLRRMLEAREQLETDDFLGTLPKLAAPAPREVVWAAGGRVGPYRLVRPLGEGGMAEVWLAERDDGAFKRQVAVKLPYPRPGRESFAVRFDRERDILASLRHPHIAGLFDAGVTKDGQAWLALEYVEGEPISTFCDSRCLTLRERVTLFRQVLLAVQHAHANLVIHRDLKPANILVTGQGEVRLLDFGIAKLLEAEGDATPETELTRQAGRSLTPRYASPEQVTGLPLTIACDVYSLGVVLYELLCGAGRSPRDRHARAARRCKACAARCRPSSTRSRCVDSPSSRRRATRRSMRCSPTSIDGLPAKRCSRVRRARGTASANSLRAIASGSG